MKTIKRTAAAVTALIMLLPLLALTPRAAQTAKNISASVTYVAEGFENEKLIRDGKAAEGATVNNGRITLTAKENIGGIYVKFNTVPTEWVITDGKKSVKGGAKGFYHEFVDVSAGIGETRTLTLSFGGNFEISELEVYSVGEIPSTVQRWEEPHEYADLLLFSSHSDDDQLYFAGLIPYYVALGYKVQVAYLTNHPKEIHRRHELLDGLWTAGCKAYPILRDLPDFRIDDLNQTIAKYESLGVSYATLEGFVIETIRRTRPLVTVTHDVNGEYGHGMHLLLSKMVREAVNKTADPSIYPASAEKYGAWQMPKTYIHLYDQNKIVLDFDVPLEHFGGKSAFRMSQLAFKCHVSQQRWSMFTDWIYGKNKEITRAAQITTYNPAHYGLYSSTVGADVAKNDMFENLSEYLFREELEEKDAQIKSLEEKIAELDAKISALEGDIGSLKGERDALTKERDSLTKERDSLKKERDEALAAIEKLKEEQQKLQNELQAEKDSLIEEIREEEKSRIEGLHAELERLQSEADSLKALTIISFSAIALLLIAAPIVRSLSRKRR